METTIANPVLTSGAATEVRRVSRRHRPERTLESKPKQNQAATSTPVEVNYPATVRECALLKQSVGESFVSRKGKSHLLKLVCDSVASQLALGKDAGATLRETHPEVFANIDAAMVNVFAQAGSDIARDYNPARGGSITVRSNFHFDRVRTVKDEAGNAVAKYEWGQASMMRGEKIPELNATQRKVLTGLVAKHQKRMDYMLDHKDDPHPDYPGCKLFSEKQLKAHAARLKFAQDTLAALPRSETAVAPDSDRDLAEKYRKK